MVHLLTDLSAEILTAVGVASDLHGPRDLVLAPRVDAPAEPGLIIQRRLALHRQDAQGHGQEPPREAGRRQSSTWLRAWPQARQLTTAMIVTWGTPNTLPPSPPCKTEPEAGMHH